MNINDYLASEEMQFALGDAAFASEAGSLLTASELSAAFATVYQENPTEMSLLQLLAENAAKTIADTTVAKVFADQKYGELKVIGIKACVRDGQFYLFGVPVPSDIATSVTAVAAGKDGEYKRTELVLTKTFKDADGEDSPVSLNFQLMMPASVPSDKYLEWLGSLLGKTKKAIVSASPVLIGDWKEPGMGNPSLLSLAEDAVANDGYASYQVTGFTSKARQKKDGTGEWTSYGLKLKNSEGELETDSWIIPRYFGFSSLMQRMITKGSQTFYIHLHGVLQQQNKEGEDLFDDDGNARMEAFGKINTIEHFPPRRKQTTIATSVAPKQMKSAEPDWVIETEIVEDAKIPF